MPDTTMATDPQVAPTTPPQGTGAPADDRAQATDDGKGSQPAPQGFDEDFLKRLDTFDWSKVDPATLPQRFNEQFVPKAEFTRKTQTLAEDRKRIETEKTTAYEIARRALAERQVPLGPNPDEVKRQKLEELASVGDMEAQRELRRMDIEKEIAPIRTQVTLQNAVQGAQSAPEVGPYVREQWNPIVQEIQASPLLARLASVDNNAGAQAVMEALGYRYGFQDRGEKLAAAAKEIVDLKAKLQGYERERTAGLPESTTRAGTTAGRPVAGEPKSLEEVDLRQAWYDSGGTPDTFR